MHATATHTILVTSADKARAARPVLCEVGTQARSCASCHLRTLCMPVEVQGAQAQQLFSNLVKTRIRLHKGDQLFCAGDRFTALHAIRVGSCKTVTSTDDGCEQVVGYHLPGDIIGIEGLGSDVQTTRAIALEDTEVCVLPFDRVQQLAHEDRTFQRQLYRLLTAAIHRERNAATMLGTMRADRRLATFLLDLSNRYQRRGYSSSEFVLRMTREEIGSHLGLKLETVSRLFSRFDDEGLIEVQGRVIKLRDRDGLQRLVLAS